MIEYIAKALLRIISLVTLPFVLFLCVLLEVLLFILLGKKHSGDLLTAYMDFIDGILE